MFNSKQLSGFSLIEMLVAMSIFILVFLVGSDFIIKGFRSTSFEAEQTTQIKSARRAMEIMAKEIRGANSSARGDYPLATIEPTNFIFYNDIDNDGQIEKIRYFLDETFLKEAVTKPGVDNSYGSPAATSTLAANAFIEPIFFYFDENNSATGVINNIRLINIKLKISSLSDRFSAPYLLESSVELRNLKDN
ncbi:MAG: prepilin-type N-terminal cleavage/methylation domain-containing protein [Patescibacteria group bacterium]|nr:prepilin-type N-terminal cleavage/methylation domain-containing protein [Patescibacteria group bacterium]MDD4610841.1 prepilin-type N-terminal cleavage/methylation domain-containing protein [Patescibacteria group bacterium]